MRTRLAALVVAGLLVAPSAAVGLSMTEVASELRCVTCGTPLDVSNAPVAQRMKEQIRQRIAEGKTKDEIKAEFVAEFGPSVLATPDKSGFDLVAWLVPGLAVLIGLGSIPFITRAWARRRPAATAAPAPLSDEDAELLQRELDALPED